MSNSYSLEWIFNLFKIIRKKHLRILIGILLLSRENCKLHQAKKFKNLRQDLRWRIFHSLRLHSIQTHILKPDIICSEFSTHVLFTYFQSICTVLISTTGPGTNLCKILTLVLPGEQHWFSTIFSCHRKSCGFFFFSPRDLYSN